MPKLKPETQRARREHILDKAEICFARAGFHRCTMQDICREADVSPGALYVYFPSKEDLIAGIAERDRAKLAGEMAELAKAPDLLSALSGLGEHYTVEQPQHKRVLCMEIACESTRNPIVSALARSVDSFVVDSFEQLLSRAQAEGKIAPARDARTIAEAFAVLGDGMFWRRAVDPGFDAKKMMPVVMELIGFLVNPVPGPGADTAVQAEKEVTAVRFSIGPTPVDLDGEAFEAADGRDHGSI